MISGSNFLLRSLARSLGGLLIEENFNVGFASTCHSLHKEVRLDVCVKMETDDEELPAPDRHSWIQKFIQQFRFGVSVMKGLSTIQPIRAFAELLMPKNRQWLFLQLLQNVFLGVKYAVQRQVLLHNCATIAGHKLTTGR